jgi:hypothetical protein
MLDVSMRANGTNSHPELQQQQQQQQQPPSPVHLGTLGPEYNGILVHRLMVGRRLKLRIWVYRAWMQIGSSLDNFRKLQYYIPNVQYSYPNVQLRIHNVQQ